MSKAIEIFVTLLSVAVPVIFAATFANINQDNLRIPAGGANKENVDFLIDVIYTMPESRSLEYSFYNYYNGINKPEHAKLIKYALERIPSNVENAVEILTPFLNTLKIVGRKDPQLSEAAGNILTFVQANQVLIQDVVETILNTKTPAEDIEALFTTSLNRLSSLPSTSVEAKSAITRITFKAPQIQRYLQQALTQTPRPDLASATQRVNMFLASLNQLYIQNRADTAFLYNPLSPPNDFGTDLALIRNTLIDLELNGNPELNEFWQALGTLKTRSDVEAPAIEATERLIANYLVFGNYLTQALEDAPPNPSMKERLLDFLDSLQDLAQNPLPRFSTYPTSATTPITPHDDLLLIMQALADISGEL